MEVKKNDNKLHTPCECCENNSKLETYCQEYFRKCPKYQSWLRKTWREIKKLYAKT